MPAMTKPLLRRGDAANELRRDLGDYVRGLREAQGMTQADLAKAVGIEYYTAISAIEVGRNSLPPERTLAFAEALGVQPKVFGREVLRLTNPWLYALLYSADPKGETKSLNARFDTRLGQRMNS